MSKKAWEPILDPQLAPDACTVAYVRDDELYVVPVAFGDPVQITYGARGTGKVGTCICCIFWYGKVGLLLLLIVDADSEARIVVWELQIP